jgi:hypothetical protein
MGSGKPQVKQLAKQGIRQISPQWGVGLVTVTWCTRLFVMHLQTLLIFSPLPPCFELPPGVLERARTPDEFCAPDEFFRHRPRIVCSCPRTSATRPNGLRVSETH